MAAQQAATGSSASNGQSAFNGRELSNFLKQSWSDAVQASNNPNIPPSERPEMFRAPGGPGGAWGGGGTAWANRPNLQRDQQMVDGQPFLVGLARAIDADKKQKK